MLLLFSGKQGGKTLSEEEILAVCEFLQKQVKPFSAKRFRKQVLKELIIHSKLEEIFTKEYDSNSKLMLK